MISKVFMSSSVAVTFQLSSPPVASGVSYAVSITPPVESPVMVGDTSAQLTVMYNIRYSVRIVATNCAGESSPNVTELFYGKIHFKPFIYASLVIMLLILVQLTVVVLLQLIVML